MQIIRVIVNMTDERKAAVAALLSALAGVVMSFLPGFVVNTPARRDFLQVAPDSKIQEYEH
jgi:hypothetical protein